MKRRREEEEEEEKLWTRAEQSEAVSGQILHTEEIKETKCRRRKACFSPAGSIRRTPAEYRSELHHRPRSDSFIFSGSKVKEREEASLSEHIRNIYSAERGRAAPRGFTVCSFQTVPDRAEVPVLGSNEA
ncbi:unnamed protein product [Pleuronectes platessa]|uniref:Uncharacterized protein n=1 Tax=Pleuronectes platessa TaxID=8262 RepID=A0A9N7UX79_PLEPL|nr:unnamed protein product [Pleuronectes platessa]